MSSLFLFYFMYVKFKDVFKTLRYSYSYFLVSKVEG